MKLTGGEFRGRKLRVPGRARPTGSRVREALFSILGERIAGARFLDLFAGSGVVGLEALSRGSSEVLFVDRNRKALASVRENARILTSARWDVLGADLPGDLGRLVRFGQWDVVFADPPYAFESLETTLESAACLLAPDGVLVLEHAARRGIPRRIGKLETVDDRRYGESSLTFFAARAAAQASEPPEARS